jgi:hypothetical protein
VQREPHRQRAPRRARGEEQRDGKAMHAAILPDAVVRAETSRPCGAIARLRRFA